MMIDPHNEERMMKVFRKGCPKHRDFIFKIDRGNHIQIINLSSEMPAAQLRRLNKWTESVIKHRRG